MQALCCCDNRQINEAVRRYIGEFDDAKVIKLLHASQANLDPYHRAALESLLDDARSQAPGDGAQLKALFESFVAANPRALEQMPPPMIEGILQRAATNDNSLRRQFTPAWFQRYIPVVSGMAGALTAALVVTGYMHFGAPKVDDSAVIPLSVSLQASMKQPPASVRVVRRPEWYKRGTAALSERHMHMRTRISIASSTAHSSVAVAIAQAARSDAIAKPLRRQETRRTPVAQGPDYRIPTAVAALPPASRLPERPPTVARAPIPSPISENAVAVEMKVVTQTVEVPEAETSTQGADPAPARYCYARGSWHAC
ncbi:MAG: hypothetical protein M3160_06375 [Candidatus Eremiobacteraeota bacterium]|nr:hypothetical protein [Candidatus Eremiobacteraeota bacterium]